MTCQEFLARHSEYVDERMDPREAALWKEHRAGCISCARFDRTVRRGGELLRGLPEIEPSYDFFPRLQHRIYNLEDDLRSRRNASTTGAVTSLAIAASLALLAWAPVLRFGHEAVRAGAEPAGGEVAVEGTTARPLAGGVTTQGRAGEGVAGAGMGGEARDAERLIGDGALLAEAGADAVQLAAEGGSSASSVRLLDGLQPVMIRWVASGPDRSSGWSQAGLRVPASIRAEPTQAGWGLEPWRRSPAGDRTEEASLAPKVDWRGVDPFGIEPLKPQSRMMLDLGAANAYPAGVSGLPISATTRNVTGRPPIPR